MTTKAHPRMITKNVDLLSPKSYAATPTARSDGSALQAGDTAYSDGTSSSNGFGTSGAGLYSFNGSTWSPSSPASGSVMTTNTTQSIGNTGAKNFKGSASLLRRGQQAKTQFIVESRVTTAQPGGPSEGQHYLLPTSPTGASWAAYSAKNLAAYTDAAWEEVAVAEGYTVYVKDENLILMYDGSNWVDATRRTVFEATGAGGTTVDIAKKVTDEADMLILYGGAPVDQSAYTIAADTPSAGQTRITFDFTLDTGVKIKIFA